MGTRGWTLSTFVGCCIWILHGLRAAAAVPVTTEGPTASAITADSEAPHVLVMGTAETSTVTVDAETAESILMGSSSSPSFPPGSELGALVTAASEYVSTVPTLTNVTKPLNASQDNERGSAALAAATTAPAISAQHPAVTPEVELAVTGTAPDAPLGATPLFADTKEDILAAVTRVGAEDLVPTASTVSLPTILPPAATWGAQPTAGSPAGASVTVLPSQGLTTATGAVEEGVTLPVDTQSEASANSLSPGTGGLLTTQQDGAVSEAVGIIPELAGETAAVAEESPSASVPGDAEDAVNGVFSTAGSSHLPPESPTVSGTVGNPGDPFLLPGQTVLSPTALLTPASGGDGDGQGGPGTPSDTPGSAPLLETSEAPAVTGDMAPSLLALRVPTDVQNDTNPPALATVLPTGDEGAAGLAEPSLQPAPWQSLTGEQPPLLAAALPSPTDTSSAPGAAYPPPGAGASTLPAADSVVETSGSPDLGAAPGTHVSPSLGGSQPWGTAAGAPQGADGPSTGLDSALDALNPVSFVPDGLAWPTAGVLAQGGEGAEDTTQSGGPGNVSPYADTQSDMNPSAISTQQDPASTGELPAGETGTLLNGELSSPSALGGGAGPGAVPALGQVSLPGPAPSGSAGLEPDFLRAEGPGELPGEFLSAPGAAYPPPGAVAGPVSAAETAVSPNLAAAQGAPMSPSFGGSQPWGTAAGAPQGAGLPEANVPGSGLTSAWDAPGSAAYGPAEPPSPSLGDQLGTNMGLPAAEGHGAGMAEPALGGAGSGTGSEPSLISSAGSGTGSEPSPISIAGSGTGSEPSLISSAGSGTGSEPSLISSAGSGTGSEPSLISSAGSGTGSEPSLISSAGSGMVAGMDQLPGAGFSSGPASPSGVVAASSVSEGDGAGLIPAAAPGPDSLALASPDSETGPEVALVGDTESTGDAAQAGNPESPYLETSPSAFSALQDPGNTGELPAGETGTLVNTELSPPSALGDGAGPGAAPALGQVSLPGPAPPGSAGLEPDLLGAEGPGELPGESLSAPGAAYPPPGAVAGPVSAAETAVSPNLAAAQGAPMSPSFGGSQPWGTAAGAPQGAGLPEANVPGSGLTSAWDAPGSAAYGPAEAPSPSLGDQLGTNMGLPAAEGHGAGMAEPVLGGAGSGTGSEPSLIASAGSGTGSEPSLISSAGSGTGSEPSLISSAGSGTGSEPSLISSAGSGTGSEPSLISSAGSGTGSEPSLISSAGSGTGSEPSLISSAGSGTGSEPSLVSSADSGMVAGMDQLPSAGSSSGPVSPSGVVAVSPVLDPASPSALRGGGGVPGALQASLGAGPGVPLAAGEGAGEAAGNGGFPGQSQAPAGEGPAGSGAPDREMGTILQSVSSSPSTEGSSSPGMAGDGGNGASLPGAGGASGGLSTSLEAAGPEEPSMSAPSIQGGANLGLSDAKLSQVNVVELPGGALANGGPSPGASLGQGAGAIIQIASGALAPSALASPQEKQPLVAVAPGGGGSDGTATSLTASLLLPGRGLSSGLAPNGDPQSAPSTQSGSRPLVPGALGGLAGDAGGAQTWSLEDEVASGMPAPSGEASPHAPASLSAAPALPSAPQRENAAEGVSNSPGPSAPLSARESTAGSSAGGRGELGAAVLGGPALLLPPHQLGNPGAPSRDANSPVRGEAGVVLPGAMAGRGDMARLLPSMTGAGAGVETPARSPLRGSPGLPGLPPAGNTAGSPGPKTPGPGLAGGSSPAARQPFLGGELTSSLANRAPSTGGSSLPAAFPGQGGARGGSPTTARPTMSCSPAPPGPLPGGRQALPRPGAATVTSRASSPVFPALPGGPAAAPTPLSSPAVPAVPLYGYGARENDREYVERRVDFNSPLFKPEIGFPFGKTLHDSLYFTDNGQIIFPASDKSIFTYPNPPPRGFNGHEEVPMIAVFWDNADFSRGVGTTFYQEFPTLNTAKPPFVRDVEAKVRRYLRSSYSAAWTLKITWEKAPAYGARTDTRRTNTYQAILTTDGFRSYVLMLYQEGGMQWDYTRLAATNVLIGYTSGDGFYRNDDLTQRPPAAKYRPDQFRGYNTDLRGMWIYKLESRVGINYRLKCLAWTGQQQNPRVWSQGLPACPCSLQQGQQDPRFKSSRRGWWASRVSMLHSASPNQHGAGVRCLYDGENQLIEGRQERYWRSSRQVSPYRDQELKLYDWCCNQAGSASLCARYSEKRPKIGCDGYQSPDMAGSSEEMESDSEEQRDGEDK